MSKRQHFFIGVRGLGPDTSFFTEQAALQASRAAHCLMQWGNDQTITALVEAIGAAFKGELGWGSPYFLPEDEWSRIAYGPSFNMVDSGNYEAAKKHVTAALGCKLDSEWEKAVYSLSLRGVVDSLAALLKQRGT